MISDDNDYLLLSGIQHFAFCRRQWALIHIEDAWVDNVLTVQGQLLHERAHDPFFTEKRKDLLITRDMPVVSHRLKITGKCDVVEFKLDNLNGVPLFGRDGKWVPCPIEYKRGRSKSTDIDRLQLCAQAICLEEMLLCAQIEDAYIYYGETKRRESVLLSKELRIKTEDMLTEMHDIFLRKITPRVKSFGACTSCSLKDICLPKMPGFSRSVRTYLDEELSVVSDNIDAEKKGSYEKVT